MSEYFKWLENKGLAEKTIRMYRVYHERLLRKVTAIDDVTQELVDEFISKNKNNVCRAFLRSYLEFMIRTTDSDSLRRLDIPKLKTKQRILKETLTEEEVLRMDKHMSSEGRSMMLLVSYYCGLRSFELLNVKIFDFNWSDWKLDRESDGLLRIPHGKGGRSATVPVKSFLMKRLRKYIRDVHPVLIEKKRYEKDKPLFQMIGFTYFLKWSRVLKQCAKDAGISVHVTPHLLRHSIAVHLVKKGWDINHIRVFLRHADISTTAIYAQIPSKQIIEMYARI